MLATPALLFFLLPVRPFQDAPPPTPTDAARVETLRERVHGMRTNLLLGGERVRQAETDAAQFYRGKIELVEQRLDSIAAELAERRAGYRLALDRALDVSGEEPRRTALREASEQRAKLRDLESEETELDERRGRLAKLVGSVEARGRERERLAARLETSTDYEEALALPLGGIGLAPEVSTVPAASPLDDQGLIEDLLALDPVGARRVLFESDPAAYWRRFPLRPPLETLARVLEFPPPDLPGQR
jgi:hypothetical protein